MTDRERDSVRRRPGRLRFLRALLCSRRGVVSVLAMMFLVLFGSLVAAMGVVSQGNMRTAGTHLHVVRAMGAAETGLQLAESRLLNATSRFMLSTSDLDGDTVWAMWTGVTGDIDGEIVVLEPEDGRSEAALPLGIAEAVALIHAADVNIIEWEGVTEPIVTQAPSGTDLTVFREDGWVVTPVISLERKYAAEEDPTTPGFQIIYAPLASGTEVRAIVIGYDFGYRRQGKPLTRVISQDFTIVKQVDHAIISPSKLMIGKNVEVVGDLGARFSDLNFTSGDPVVLKSDFYDLDEDLDDILDAFYEGVDNYDVDGDSRLRLAHPVEKQGVPGGTDGEDSETDIGEPYHDATQDGYLDELDLFINFYDENEDGQVALSDAMRDGTPNEALDAEFVLEDGVTPVDEGLELLIDASTPDRNRNGRFEFADLDGDGVWDPEDEPHDDFDSFTNSVLDQELGYRDGVIDRLDRYVKLQGAVKLAVTENAWSAAQGDYTDKLRGAVRPPIGTPPRIFDADSEDLPSIDSSSFVASETALGAAADGDAFWEQVASNLGVDLVDLDGYVEVEPEGSSNPRYTRLDGDLDYDGLPDNFASAYFERMPFNSPNFTDWYYRPVFENMVFKDVIIPRGVNGLFVGCEFIGVTRVESHTDTSHVHWPIFGRMEFDSGSGYPVPSIDREAYGDDAGEDGSDAPPMLPGTAIPPAQVLMLATGALDKGDVLDSEISTYAAGEYDQLPDPLVIDGVRVSNTKDYSNNLRFHDCLFVGSIVSDKPSVFSPVRNKIQFTGATQFRDQHPEFPGDSDLNPEEDDLAEIAKSSMMLPNYSVDIGTFNSPPEQDVKLRGAIIAGVLDVRGNAEIDGALLMTYRPEYGVSPMIDALGNPVGNPAQFNTTIGYFGPDNGDAESLDPQTLPIEGGERIVGWDTDGDGLADVPSTSAQPAGSTAVPFFGYGRIRLRFDPEMTLPDGILLPLASRGEPGSYREGES